MTTGTRRKEFGFGLRVPGSGQGLLALVLAVGFGLAAGSAYPLVRDTVLPAPQTVAGATVSAHFGMCHGSHRMTCIVDGDTLWVKGEKIRIADIDAPEVFSPKCKSELALGQKATARLLELVNQGPFVLVRSSGRDRDIYGRQLRVLSRNGQSLGAELVAQGLARSWDGARHGWCG